MTTTIAPQRADQTLSEEDGLTLFTRDQFHALLDKGILVPREKYELIEGKIYRKMTQNPPHRICLNLLGQYLREIFPPSQVQEQATIDTGKERKRSEPDPDFAVTKEPTTRYRDRNPGPDDILLVVEISDTTLRRDLGAKRKVYEKAGIGEYWVVDVVGRRLFAHRWLDEDGYDVTEYSESASVAPQARPGAIVQVSELLPPIEETP